MINCTCPNCGANFELNDSYAGMQVSCSQCNTQFIVNAAQSQPNARPVTPNSPQFKRCANCGNAIPLNSKRCPHCGQNTMVSQYPNARFFNGRISRKGFAIPCIIWLATIFLADLVSGIVVPIVDRNSGGLALALYLLFTLIPYLLVFGLAPMIVRRLHDLNLSGFVYVAYLLVWFILAPTRTPLQFIIIGRSSFSYPIINDGTFWGPFICLALPLWLMLAKGQECANEYGEPPEE